MTNYLAPKVSTLQVKLLFFEPPSARRSPRKPLKIFANFAAFTVSLFAMGRLIRVGNVSVLQSGCPTGCLLSDSCASILVLPDQEKLQGVDDDEKGVVNNKR
jgi:hypothetical protein